MSDDKQPLIAGNAIRLHSPDIPEAVIEDFAFLFERAVKMIPPGDLGTISAYWQSRSAPPGMEGRCVPYRDFLPRLYLRAGEGLPYCDYYGHQPVFFPATLEEMGPELAVAAIAHEMAHVLLFATSDQHHWADPAREGRTKQEAEAAAERRVDETLCSWGIDQSACQAWVTRWKARRATTAERG